MRHIDKIGRRLVLVLSLVALIDMSGCGYSFDSVASSGDSAMIDGDISNVEPGVSVTWNRVTIAESEIEPIVVDFKFETRPSNVVMIKMNVSDGDELGIKRQDKDVKNSEIKNGLSDNQNDKKDYFIKIYPDEQKKEENDDSSLALFMDESRVAQLKLYSILDGFVDGNQDVRVSFEIKSDDVGYDLTIDQTVTVVDDEYVSTVYQIQDTAHTDEKCDSLLKLTEGRYRFEAWGASGGDGYDSNQTGTRTSVGGLGGYATGELDLDKDTDVYIHYGTKGVAAVGNGTGGGGCNGGGDGSSSSEYYGYGGGGASDVRIGVNDYDHRILVAGGGGGADNDERWEGDDGSGGYGGGIKGGNGKTNGAFDNDSSGGTQTTGAAFGSGGSSDGSYDLGGGGGGWFGGKAGTNGNSGGGGGSGFVLSHDNQEGYKNLDRDILDGNYILLKAQTFSGDGNDDFPAVEVKGDEKGHYGNGAIRITRMTKGD